VLSNEAELCGVFAAVYTALTQLDSAQANILVVKTDCQTVARWFGWKRSPCVPEKPEALDLVTRTLEHANEKRIRLVVSWVKGHRGLVDTQAYLNTQVDRLARAARITGKGTIEVQAIRGSKSEPQA